MNFDYSIFSAINNLAGHHKVLDLLMVSMAKYGVLLSGRFLLYIWFKEGGKTENKRLALKAVLAALIALGINQVIGLFYFRLRPFAHHHVNMLVDKSPDPSFPSDHSTGSSSLTFAVLTGDKLLGSVMTVVTLLMMFSRVYVGAHYPLDVLGGVLTGLAGSLAANLLWPKVEGIADKLINLTRITNVARAFKSM